MAFRLSSDEGRGKREEENNSGNGKGSALLYCVVSSCLARERIGTRIFAPQVTTTCLERTACHAQAGQSQFSSFCCMYRTHKAAKKGQAGGEAKSMKVMTAREKMARKGGGIACIQPHKIVGQGGNPLKIRRSTLLRFLQNFCTPERNTDRGGFFLSFGKGLGGFEKKS